MATFPISIDTTGLFYQQFLITGPGGYNSGVLVGNVNNTLALPQGPGYRFQIGSSNFADFSFDVTVAGVVTYSGTPPFLSGKGTKKLTIRGFPITIDARYLAADSLKSLEPDLADPCLKCKRIDPQAIRLFLDPFAPNPDWILYKTVNLVPASYRVQQGSGVVCPFTFTVGLNGKVRYDERYDIKLNCGFLGGMGTSTIEFYGYPLLVDARKAGGYGVAVWQVWGIRFSTSQVQYVNLLPVNNNDPQELAYNPVELDYDFVLQTEGGRPTKARFKLDVNGIFTPSSAAAKKLFEFSKCCKTGCRCLTVLTVKDKLPQAS
jgi:hypothetical protein